MNGILSARELADMLDCDVQRVHEAAATGDLPAVKYGRGWIFPTEATFSRLNKKAVEDADARRAPHLRNVQPIIQPSPSKAMPRSRGRARLPLPILKAL
jgi:hypothetical protein